RGLQEEQERAYRAFEAGKAEAPPRVLIVIEEAHEFLGAERSDKTPHLFAQVARIAKRGRKRWLGLAFVTQLPGHLPRRVLGLVTNYVLHKITDPHVISTLRHTAGGIDDSLWSRLPGLAPGQAIVSLGHMTRPVLVSMDPAPCKLRMVEGGEKKGSHEEHDKAQKEKRREAMSTMIEATLVPVRALNQVTYCPRLYYLQYVDSVMPTNEHVEGGLFDHRRVNDPELANKSRKDGDT